MNKAQRLLVSGAPTALRCIWEHPSYPHRVRVLPTSLESPLFGPLFAGVSPHGALRSF